MLEFSLHRGSFERSCDELTRDIEHQLFCAPVVVVEALDCCEVANEVVVDGFENLRCPVRQSAVIVVGDSAHCPEAEVVVERDGNETATTAAEAEVRECKLEQVSTGIDDHPVSVWVCRTPLDVTALCCGGRGSESCC